MSDTSKKDLLPEEKARVKIDKMLFKAGWAVVSRNEFTPSINAQAVKETLLKGNHEADYVLFLDNKAIAVIEAKRQENDLGEEVEKQATNYTSETLSWIQTWQDPLPFIFLSNGEKLLFKDLRKEDAEFEELQAMLTPKEIVERAGNDVITSEYAKLPQIPPVGPKGLRQCQFDAITNLELSFKKGLKKALIVLATGAGKTFTACTAAYRLLNYTSAKRVLFLVDRNNLGKQALGEFGEYKLTETGEPFGGGEYVVSRLKKLEQIGDASVVISTIQRLFAVLTGKQIEDDSDDDEVDYEEEEPKEKVHLTENVLLPPDYFDVIIVDECHRSIYGNWNEVLKYFKNAKIIGLTATPTPEAQAFFNDNYVVNYSLEDSIVDGVNVPPRVYRIKTQITENGGTLKEGNKVKVISNATGQQKTVKQEEDKEYTDKDLDRSVVSLSQIETVVRAYKDSIFEDLYPDRKKDWNMIPKTLFFAKKESHANDIMNAINKVFGEEFPDGKLPEHYAQKITCTAGNTNQLISDFRNDKNFRIAVTVTLVATGTDVKPLEVLVFMRDIRSAVLYTQMKGRGCRTIKDEALKNVTTNATSKDCYYLVDAVGVTEHEHTLPGTEKKPYKKTLSMEKLLEHLAHGEVTNENLYLLACYLAKVNHKGDPKDVAELNKLLGITTVEKTTKSIFKSLTGGKLEEKIKDKNEDTFAFFTANATIPPFEEKGDNKARKELIAPLINNVKARNKAIEIYRGFLIVDPTPPGQPGGDTLLGTGFTKEQAQEYVDCFEDYINNHKDEVEALRILYNQENIAISYSMLKDLEEKLKRTELHITADYLWNCYSVLDSEKGTVKPLNKESEANVLTNLIQLVRYGFKIDKELVSLKRGYGKYFNLYCGQKWRNLTDDQLSIVKQIADYLVKDGYLSNRELVARNKDLFLDVVQIFGADKVEEEIRTLTKYIFYGKAA